MIGNAIRVAQIATGEVEEEFVAEPEENEAAPELGRKGGAARAKAMTQYRRGAAQTPEGNLVTILVLRAAASRLGDELSRRG